jgi:hypothetical protein
MRVFDAPRRLVFDAFTKPELLKRWFGPHGWSLVVCEVDLRVGGTFRFVLRGPDGREMGMRGVYPRGFLYVSDEEQNKIFRLYPDGRREVFFQTGDPDGSTLV